MGSKGSSKVPKVVETPVYRSSYSAEANSVTSAVAQDISAQNMSEMNAQQQLRKRSGGIMASYERFSSDQTGKTKLGA